MNPFVYGEITPVEAFVDPHGVLVVASRTAGVQCAEEFELDAHGEGGGEG